MTNAQQRTPSLTIRRSRDTDALALGRLAQMDATLYTGAEALIAELDGRPVAALPLDGSRPFADPFVHTLEPLALLELRRDQLEACREAGRPRVTRVLRAVRRRRRYRAPASA